MKGFKIHLSQKTEVSTETTNVCKEQYTDSWRALIALIYAWIFNIYIYNCIISMPPSGSWPSLHSALLISLLQSGTEYVIYALADDARPPKINDVARIAAKRYLVSRLVEIIIYSTCICTDLPEIPVTSPSNLIRWTSTLLTRLGGKRL